MDEKLIATVNKIKLLAEQNPEFNQTMQKLFGNTVSASIVNIKFYYYRRLISAI